jgi:hypothetical protein
MWHDMDVQLKIKHLREKYPNILMSVVFQHKPLSPEYALTTSSQGHPTSQSHSSGLSFETSSSITSKSKSLDDESRGISFQRQFILGSVQIVTLGNLNAVKGPITPILALEILRMLIGSENIDEMLSFFISQLLIRTGIGHTLAYIRCTAMWTFL